MYSVRFRIETELRAQLQREDEVDAERDQADDDDEQLQAVSSSTPGATPEMSMPPAARDPSNDYPGSRSTASRTDGRR